MNVNEYLWPLYVVCGGDGGGDGGGGDGMIWCGFLAYLIPRTHLTILFQIIVNSID